jgi:hypothetical protein
MLTTTEQEVLIRDSIFGMFLHGTVTGVPGANQFTIPSLAGFGAGAFASVANPWQALVLRKGTGTGAAPQGEQQPVTVYVNATGVFTTSAFTLPIAIGDEIALLNPDLAGGIQDIINTNKLVNESLFELELWSAIAPQVVIPAVAADQALPPIVIASIPAGATLKRAIMMIRWRTTENTNGAANALSGAQNIQAKKDVGGAYITAFAFAGGCIAVPITTREGGMSIMGTSDITAQVPANGAQMDFKWTLALAAHASLNLNDVQMGLQLVYAV